jgi:transglutaminase-like putative cysteine protease
VSYALDIAPKPHFLNWQQDPQGNFLARVVFPERVTHFDLTVDLVADMTTVNPFDFFLEPDAEAWPFTYDPVLEQELAPFHKAATPGPLLAALLVQVPRGEQRTVDMLVALNRMVQSRIGYIVRMEPGVWTPEETLGNASGSCRDSAWVLVQLLRNLGYAARFVSGYLIQLVADVKPLVGPAGPSADFTDLHAWAEVYLPGAGWIGLDATSGLMAGEGHIPLAASPDPMSAAAISGVVEPCETEFEFAMSVRRISESPRVTKPYSEAQWQDILAAGTLVDHALTAGDVRLTLGGEPTFVSATDIDAPEWNTDAMGPTKRAYAGRLLRRLAPLWAPGAALQYGMGKQYPGEQLPRWALHAHWRADGETVWTDPALLAAEDDTDTAQPADAARFAALLAERLQIDPGLIIPAYEDIYYYLWRERTLPANVVVEDAKLRDTLERARLAHVFSHGLASPVGSVLPLRRVIEDGARRWQSGKWYFRGDTMFLLPGDSPVGLRLPLESLPWVDPETIEYEIEPDPFAPRPPFASAQAIHAALHRPARGPSGGGPLGGAASAFDISSPPGAAGAAGRRARRAEHRAHRIDLRIPRRPAAHLPAAAVQRRGLAGACRRNRIDRARAWRQDDPGGLPAAVRSTAAAFLGHPRSRRDRGERPPRHQLGRARYAHRAALRGSPPGWSGNGKIHARWAPCRHRRRQPRGDGRRARRGQPVPAPARSAEVATGILAQPPEPVLPVQRAVHRPDQPAPAHRRGAAGQPDRAGDRLRADRAISPDAALAHRPAVPQSAGRHDRQHASHRVLHRQDVCARGRLRPPRPGGVPRLRDATARPHVGRADAADARRRRRVLAVAV